MKKTKVKKAKGQRALSRLVVPSDAWKVMRDARLAFGDFKKAVEAGDAARCRIYWILCVTLLRAVGHILEKKDAARSQWLATSVKSHYQELQRRRLGDLIYWEFIVEERNILLKEYSASIIEKNGCVIELTNLLVGGVFYTPADAIETSLGWWADNLRGIQEQADIHKTRDRQASNSRTVP